MKQILCVLGLLLWAVPVWAIPITYNLVVAELTSSFTLDQAQANPFVAWQFEYKYPEATRITGFTTDDLVIVVRFPSPILGQTWGTEDGSLWNTRSHMLTVTNADNMTLSYQLCYLICSEQPNLFAMSIYDHAAGIGYSGNGRFEEVVAIQTPVLFVATVKSVLEPSPGWLLAGGLGVLLVVARRRAIH